MKLSSSFWRGLVTPFFFMSLTHCISRRPLVPSPPLESAIPVEISPPPPSPYRTKWDLWTHDTLLRGANIWQKRIDPEIDELAFGKGSIGPPYSQADLNGLSALGANYVNLSLPGLFTEEPPYHLDEAAQKNLDRWLDRCTKADLFVVISFRTGPGRNEAGFDEGQRRRAVHKVWKSEEAQDAWVTMWRYTAKRYAKSSVVVGYHLMVEPNANAVWLTADTPEKFYSEHQNSLYDWNPLAKRVSEAIREGDENTPILISAMNYGNVGWLGLVKVPHLPRIVLNFHFYEPYRYTHYEGKGKGLSYPGKGDVDGDGIPETIDRAWLDARLFGAKVVKRALGIPISVGEFGTMRWEPGAEKYLEDTLSLFEGLGLNHAIWLWESSLPSITYDQFNYRRGKNSDQHQDILSNELLKVLKRNWKRNAIRPSGVAVWR